MTYRACSLSFCLVLGAGLVDASPAAAGESIPQQLPAGTLTEPLSIQHKSIVAGHAEGKVLSLTTNEPALLVDSREPVMVEGVTIRWQLATSGTKNSVPAAIVVKDSELTLRNCRIEALGNAARCPTAFAATGFSKVRLEKCEFTGFDFTVTSSGGANVILSECSIRSPGHCGASVYSASTLELDRCLVTGSKFHGVRCTGGTLDVRNSLIIGNQNRGIYLGNNPAEGRVSNNLIHSNGAGISGFSSSRVAIENNVFAANTYSGIDSRETCRLTVTNNIFTRNEQGFVLFVQGGANQVVLSNNNFWANQVDLKDFEQPSDFISVDPNFVDSKAGRYGSQNESEWGLSPTAAAEIESLWKLWKPAKQ